MKALDLLNVIYCNEQQNSFVFFDDVQIWFYQSIYFLSAFSGAWNVKRLNRRCVHSTWKLLCCRKQVAIFIFSPLPRSLSGKLSLCDANVCQCTYIILLLEIFLKKYWIFLVFWRSHVSWKRAGMTCGKGSQPEWCWGHMVSQKVVPEEKKSF